MCVCNLRYPACNTHAPYCHLWSDPLYNIFPHYLTNGTILEKKSLNTKCVFWFSVQLLSETFLILKRTERDVIKIVIWCSWKVPVIREKYRLFFVKNTCYCSWKVPVFVRENTGYCSWKVPVIVREKYRLLLPGLVKTWVFTTDFFEKSSNIKFLENPSSGSRVVTRGRTDGHDEADRRFSLFCEKRFKNRSTSFSENKNHKKIPRDQIVTWQNCVPVWVRMAACVHLCSYTFMYACIYVWMYGYMYVYNIYLLYISI